MFGKAVERLVEPIEVKHERLLLVSILGFFVNIIGIVIFQHGGKYVCNFATVLAPITDALE